MSPQMGVFTADDDAIIMAAHEADTITHGTVDDIADQTDIETHRLDADAHHSEEIPDGRGLGAGVTYLTIPGIWAAQDATQALALNQIWYFTIYVRTPITIDQVVIEVTANAGAGERCRIAIYEADVNWQPGVLVVASAEIAIDAIAVVTTAIAATVLQEGRYLIAIILEGTATLRSTRMSTHLLGFLTTLGALPFTSNPQVAQAYGALPDPGTAWDTVTAVGEGQKYPIWLRVSVP